MLAMLAACASTKAPAPRVAPSPCTLPAKVRLEASERINPDSNGQALPTVIRIYQMQAINRVEESDFEAIWDTPKEALGDDLVGSRDLTMFPGQAQLIDLPLKPQVRFLVAVAIFRRPTGTQWRAIVPLPESARLCAAYQKKGAPDPAITFRFDQYRVEGRSRLLSAGNDSDLPTDVAPDAAPRKKNQP